MLGGAVIAGKTMAFEPSHQTITDEEMRLFVDHLHKDGRNGMPHCGLCKKRSWLIAGFTALNIIAPVPGNKYLPTNNALPVVVNICTNCGNVMQIAWYAIMKSVSNG